MKNIFKVILLSFFLASIYIVLILEDHKNEFETKLTSTDKQSNQFPWNKILSNSTKKQNVDFLLIISSAPFNSIRRKYIRQTWWNDCFNSSYNIKCIFMTEMTGKEDLDSQTHKEMLKYNDIIIQPQMPNVEFGLRFLYHLLWSTTNYHFRWLIRADDDVFVDLNQYLSRIPTEINTLQQHYIRGYLHCIEGIVRVDESLILISSFTIMSFIKQPTDQIICHPLADQQISLWVEQLDLGNIFYNDPYYSHGVFHSLPNKDYYYQNICKKDGFYSIHKVLDENDMNILYENCKNHKKRRFPFQIINSINYQSKSVVQCRLFKNKFEWWRFDNRWKYGPKKCITHPIWDTRGLINPAGIYQST